MGSSPSLPHGALMLVKILCVSTWPSAWQLVLLAQHLVIVTVTISPSPMHTHIRFAPALNTWAQGGVKRSLRSLGTLRFCNNDAPPHRCAQVHMHVCLATQSNTHTRSCMRACKQKYMYSEAKPPTCTLLNTCTPPQCTRTLYSPFLISFAHLHPAPYPGMPKGGTGD